MLIVTADQMREIESSAIEFDITIPRLMENAGSAAASFIRKIFPVESLNCVVFCGNGNNGGDGFVVARRLSENGAKVVVVLVNGTPKTDAAIQMFDALKTFEIPILTIEDNRALVESYAQHADLIVDAIYGIGFRDSRLPTAALLACQIINDAPAAVVSLDLPSGINADHGDIAFGSVKADFTVVFQILKPAHMLPQSKQACGDIHIAEIGIPKEIYENIDSHFAFIDPKRVFLSLPIRREESHKGNYGKLLAICGSYHYRGAAVLAVSGALRIGLGLCTLAAPEAVCSNLINHLPEAVVMPLPTNANKQIDFDNALPILQTQVESADTILFGCGSGSNHGSLCVLEFLLSNAKCPLVLDADALDLLAQNMHLLESAKANIVITPHPGEMARLTGLSVSDVQKNRITTALSFAEKHNLTVVLKGHDTIVAQKNGKLRINTSGGSGLAKAGSGDVLAGMLAGLTAQGMPVSEASTAAVWLHGTAGDLCEKRLSARTMLPHDILDDLPTIFKDEEAAYSNEFLELEETEN